MGFTPAEGLIMGTRCGDIDAGVLAFLERTDGTTATQSEQMLNKKSGLLGLSGVSRTCARFSRPPIRATPAPWVALKAFSYRVRKFIGSYAAAMGGVDVILFTGGIGQGSRDPRPRAAGPRVHGRQTRRAAQSRGARLLRGLSHLHG